MPFSRPAGDAANLATGGVIFPVPPARIGFKQGGDYTPPLGNAVLADFPVISSPADYVFPLGNAANFALAGESAFYADGAVTVSPDANGDAYHPLPAGIADGSTTIDVVADGQAAVGVIATGDAAITVSVSATLSHGVGGTGASEITLTVAGEALHPRYELRGEIRHQGVLVDRTVRAYRRDTGAMAGEAVTSGGKFAINCGFELREHYIVPIHLDDLADDFNPPTANRVLSVLAMDGA